MKNPSCEDNSHQPQSNQIRAALFDWGGTLAAVRREDQVWKNCAAAAVSALRAAGCPLPRDAEGMLIEEFIAVRALTQADPMGRELDFGAFLRSWLDGLGVKGVRQTVADEAIQAFWQAWTDCLDLLDAADAVLGRLKMRDLRLGVVSNVVAPREYCLAQLKQLGLLQHLSTLTFSSELGMSKPRPEVYDHALAQLQQLFDGTPLQPHQVLFVGDSPLCDVAGPAERGLRTALIVHPDVESPWPTSDYEKIDPTFRITHLSELLSIL